MLNQTRTANTSRSESAHPPLAQVLSESLTQDHFSANNGKRSQLYRRGQHLFRMGDAVKDLYVIQAGAVKTYSISETGDQQIIDFYLVGDVVGFDAMAHGTSQTTAQALDTTSVVAVRFDDLFRHGVLDDNGKRALLCRLSELRQREQELVFQLANKPAMQRFAWFISRLSHQIEEQGFSGDEFTIPMSRTDMANYLGLAVETVCRVISKLREQQVIDVERRQVHILDAEKLDHLMQEAATETLH